MIRRTRHFVTLHGVPILHIALCLAWQHKEYRRAIHYITATYGMVPKAQSLYWLRVRYYYFKQYEIAIVQLCLVANLHFLLNQEGYVCTAQKEKVIIHLCFTTSWGGGGGEYRLLEQANKYGISNCCSNQLLLKCTVIF